MVPECRNRDAICPSAHLGTTSACQAPQSQSEPTYIDAQNRRRASVHKLRNDQLSPNPTLLSLVCCINSHPPDRKTVQHLAPGCSLNVRREEGGAHSAMEVYVDTHSMLPRFFQSPMSFLGVRCSLSSNVEVIISLLDQPLTS